MDSNSQLTDGSCLAIIILGILFISLFILGPILITIEALTSNYTPLIITYLFAMISMTACFTFIPDITTKFIFSGIIAFIFACVFCSWYSTHDLMGNYNHGGLDDFIGMFVLSFTLMVPCFFAGMFSEKRIEEFKQRKNEAKKNRISKEIHTIATDNDSLSLKISTHRRELKLLKLLEKCGGDIAALEDNPSFADIVRLEEKINKNDKRMGELKELLKKL